MAALNLLSDLKDQCGWLVEQPREGKAAPGSEPQVATVYPTSCEQQTWACVMFALLASA